MSDLQLIKSEYFGPSQCDFYRNERNEILMTREQIGRALEYADGSGAIEVIHRRAPERFATVSTSVKLTAVDGKARDTVVYNKRGIMEICRFSRQPKADTFMDWAWDVIERIAHVPAPTTQLEVLQMAINQMVQQERRLNALEGQVQNIKDTICDRPEDWRAEVNEMLNSAAYRSGGGDKYREIKQYSYDELDRRAAARIEIRLDNMKERMAGKIPKKAYDKLCYLDVIAEDKRLREIYWQIVKEIAIKYAA